MTSGESMSLALATSEIGLACTATLVLACFVFLAARYLRTRHSTDLISYTLDGVELMGLRLCAKKRSRKLPHVLKEILETERRYSAGLGFVVENFIKPLEESGCEDVSQVVFPLWKPLHHLHLELVSELEKNYHDAVNPVAAVRFMCETLLIHAPYFKIYKTVVSQYNKALMRYSRDLRSAGPLSRLVANDAVQREATLQANGGSLTPLLATPFQRLCKYPLLLRELSEASMRRWRAGRAAHRAFVEIEAIVREINQARHHVESSQRILRVQEKLSKSSVKSIPAALRMPLQEPLLQAHRKLLGEFPLSGWTATPASKPTSVPISPDMQPGHLVFLSDMLLLVQRVPRTMWSAEKLNLQHCIVRESLSPLEDSSGHPEKESAENTFEQRTLWFIWSRPSPWSKLVVGVRFSTVADFRTFSGFLDSGM